VTLTLTECAEYLLTLLINMHFSDISPLFTACRKTSFASAVYATANSIVHLSVRPSVTLQYCVKMGERIGIQCTSRSPMAIWHSVPSQPLMGWFMALCNASSKSWYQAAIMSTNARHKKHTV